MAPEEALLHGKEGVETPNWNHYHAGRTLGRGDITEWVVIYFGANPILLSNQKEERGMYLFIYRVEGTGGGRRVLITMERGVERAECVQQVG